MPKLPLVAYASASEGLGSRKGEAMACPSCGHVWHGAVCAGCCRLIGEESSALIPCAMERRDPDHRSSAAFQLAGQTGSGYL